MMKTQQMYRKFDADKRELVDEQFAALQEIFNIPRQEGAKISLPSTKIVRRSFSVSSLNHALTMHL